MQASPSLSTTTETDRMMKHSVINDTLNIVCPQPTTPGGGGGGTSMKGSPKIKNLGGFTVLYDELDGAGDDDGGGGGGDGGGSGGAGGGVSLSSAAALRRAAAAARNSGAARRGSVSRPGSARPTSRIGSAGPGGRTASSGSPRAGVLPGRKKDTV